LTIPVTGSLGILLDAVDESRVSTTEALEILQQIQQSSAWLGDDLIGRVEREIKESKRDEAASSQNTSR
jgi:predicted nucleic acid-binding protein